MAKIPRVRERTATAEELEEDRRRCLAAKAKPPTPETDEGNLCRTLAFLAAWKPCTACGARVLYVDEQTRTDTKFICGRCDARGESLGEQAKLARAASRPRRPLPSRVGLHAWGLFSIVNDNSQVAHAS
jgi:hypothetical protein